MGIFTEIGNRALIRELEREINTDILLFGFDGFTYFGNLQNIDDCRIAVMTPAILASSTDVEVLTPGGELEHVEFARIDLWQVVAKGTGVVSDPIDNSPGGLADRKNDTKPEEMGERQESHHLIRILSRMIGDEIAITTLGGFLFEGILSSIECELAILTVDDIFVPGTSTSISDTKVRSVVVNLEAITSVLGKNTSAS